MRDKERSKKGGRKGLVKIETKRGRNKESDEGKD